MPRDQGGNSLPHVGTQIFFGDLRDRSWRLRCSLRLKARLQNWHLYFFSGADVAFFGVVVVAADSGAVVAPAVGMTATGEPAGGGGAGAGSCPKIVGSPPATHKAFRSRMRCREDGRCGHVGAQDRELRRGVGGRGGGLVDEGCS